jgi:SPP1 family predicted phage head-tail adaptor
MIDPGRLKTRLVLEAPVETPDGQGGVVRGYEIAATVWASLMPVRSSTGVVAGAEGAQITHRIVLRATVPLSLRYRFRLGERVFTIAGIRDGAERRYHEIDAVERID